MKRFDWKGALAKAFGVADGKLKIYHPETGEEGVIYSESEVKELLRNAYDEGFSESQATGPAYDPASIDAIREDYIDKIMSESE